MWDYFIREGGGRIILLGRGGEVVAILMCLRFNNNEMKLSVGFCEWICVLSCFNYVFDCLLFNSVAKWLFSGPVEVLKSWIEVRW